MTLQVPKAKVLGRVPSFPILPSRAAQVVSKCSQIIRRQQHLEDTKKPGAWPEERGNEVYNLPGKHA